MFISKIHDVFVEIGHDGCHDTSENVGELRSMQGKFSFNNLGVRAVGKPGNCLSNRQAH
jgi:hypothetical protein